MCADCWGVKDAARARRWLRQRSETDPLFDLDELLSAENLLWAVGFAVLLLLAVVWGLTEWI